MRGDDYKVGLASELQGQAQRTQRRADRPTISPDSARAMMAAGQSMEAIGAVFDITSRKAQTEGSMAVARPTSEVTGRGRKRKETCHFYQQGNCNKGESCTWTHHDTVRRFGGPPRAYGG